MRYLNFDLLIHEGNSGLIARVVASPLGTGRAQIEIVPSLSSEPEKIGAALFNSVFVGEVRTLFFNSLTLVRAREMGLRIRLILDSLESLHEFQWETLFDAESQQFFGLSIETPIVRYLEVRGFEDNLRLAHPLRIIAASSVPMGYEILNVEREWKSIRKALGQLKPKKNIQILRVKKATRSKLQGAVRKDYQILHIQGHGEFDEDTGVGVLVLEDENREGAPIDGNSFGHLVADPKKIRLVILNVCKGGKYREDRIYSGLAQSLIKKGIPAVVAMNNDISDEAAIVFAREFYTVLAEKFPLEYALAEARKAILAESKREWMTPILFSRISNSEILEQDPNPKSSPLVSVVILDSARLLEDLEAQTQSGNIVTGLALSRYLKQGATLLEKADQLENDDFGLMIVYLSKLAYCLLTMITDAPLGNPIFDVKVTLRIRNLFDESDDGDEKYQLAVCYFFFATLTVPARFENIKDVRRLFEKLNKFGWVRRCDQVLKNDGSNVHLTK